MPSILNPARAGRPSIESTAIDGHVRDDDFHDSCVRATLAFIRPYRCALSIQLVVSETIHRDHQDQWIWF